MGMQKRFCRNGVDELEDTCHYLIVLNLPNVEHRIMINDLTIKLKSFVFFSFVSVFSFL